MMARSIAAALLLLALAVAGPAGAGSQVQVSADVVGRASVAAVQAMAFGRLVPGVGGGTATIEVTGGGESFSTAGNLVSLGGWRRGELSLACSQGTPYRFSLPAQVTLMSPTGATMTASINALPEHRPAGSSPAQSATGFCGTGGTGPPGSRPVVVTRLFLGGTLSVAGAQPSGLYSGIITVVIDLD